jgi:O-antigen ligase
MAYYFFIVYRPDLTKIKKYYYVIIGAFCIALLYIILQHYLGRDIIPFRYDTFQWDGGKRIYPLYGQFSSIILMIILPVLMFSKKISKNEKSFLVLALLPIFLGVYISFSRTSIISLTVSICVMLLLKNKKAYVLVILLVIFAVTLYHVKRGDNNLLTSIVDITNPQNVRCESNNQRITMLKDSWDIIKNNPVTGIGFYGYKHYRPGFHDKIFNDYLGVLATMGILGLIPFLWLVGVLFKGAYSGIKLINSPSSDDFYILASFGIFLSFISFLISALLESIFFNSEPLLLILLLLSINKAIIYRLGTETAALEGE